MEAPLGFAFAPGSLIFRGFGLGAVVLVAGVGGGVRSDPLWPRVDGPWRGPGCW